MNVRFTQIRLWNVILWTALRLTLIWLRSDRDETTTSKRSWFRWLVLAFGAKFIPAMKRRDIEYNSIPLINMRLFWETSKVPMFDTPSVIWALCRSHWNAIYSPSVCGVPQKCSDSNHSWCFVHLEWSKNKEPGGFYHREENAPGNGHQTWGRVWVPHVMSSCDITFSLNILKRHQCFLILQQMDSGRNGFNS